MLDVAKKLNREENITVILITHFMEEALMADRVVVMDDGMVAMDGSPKEVFAESDRLRSLGLSVPTATLIAEELADRGLPIDTHIMDRKELVDALCQLL